MDAWLGLTAKPRKKKAGAANTETAKQNKKNKNMRALEKRQAAQNAENQPIPANSKRRRQASCKSNGKQKQQLKLSFSGGGRWCLGTSAVAEEAAGSAAAAGTTSTFSRVATSTSSDTVKSTPMTVPVAGCDASTNIFEEDAKGLVDNQQPASAPDQHPISSTAPPVPISSPSAQPSSRISSSPTPYEKARLANIARNREFMETLGLEESAGALNDSNTRRSSAAPRPRSRKRLRPATVAVGQRRSSRIRARENGIITSGATTGSEFSAEPDPPREEDLPFDDSLVPRYATAANDALDPNKDEAGPSLPLPDTSPDLEGRRLFKYEQVGVSFSDESIKKIYSMSFSNSGTLLAVAGHQGRAVVFSAAGAEYGSSLMSFKAHKGWVASVQFLQTGHLLTAANDAAVTLWDLSKVLCNSRNARPRILTSCDDLHRNGIFSAHARDGQLVTASKDKTVNYAQFTEAEIRSNRCFEGFHRGVVKCAQLRDAHVLASTGNDRCINVFDARSEAGLVVSIPETHRFSVNSVSWHPTDPNQLMSASFGNTIKLWDMRSPSSPVQQLRGHAMMRDHQRGGIYHPVYVESGRSVVTPGANSDTLSIFDVNTGTLVSKGVVELGEVTTVASSDARGSRIAASKGSSIVLMDAVHEQRAE